MTPAGTRTNPTLPTDFLVFGQHGLARGRERCAQENVSALPGRKHCPTQAGVPRTSGLYLTPLLREVNTAGFMLHGICLYPLKMEEVLRKTYRQGIS